MSWSAAQFLLAGFVAGMFGAVFVLSLLRSQSVAWNVVPVGCLAIAGLAGAVVGEFSYTRAIIIILFGSAALLAAAQAIQLLTRGDAIEIQSNWGGLGGALGGWRFSPATSLLLLSLAFAGGAVGAATFGKPQPEGGTTQSRAPGMEQTKDRTTEQTKDQKPAAPGAAEGQTKDQKQPTPSEHAPETPVKPK